ncbi:UMP-CMP kinase family protein [Cryptosporidium meleagridis]|uniref:UMP-CMP kinase family protein n=1 Tax=Cryptosporidium meleagridis TaxID=93969 RepID=A0A2P4YWM1_9CRYT|nr:UMP-CMP kinase family protein [Cryptosporidium meleagridis]
MSQNKPFVLFCLGPPGSGKGTQCAKIVDEFSFIHLSAGDCLREAMSRKDETSDLIDSYIREGLIVPVEITVSLLKKKMQEHGWNDKYFLIDGFPRNKNNLDGWQKIIPDTDVNVIGCLFLNCDDNIVVERLLHRGETSGRVDDNEETIVKRLKVYHEETTPIIEYFKNSNKCFTVDTTGSIESVWEELKKLFKEKIISS